MSTIKILAGIGTLALTAGLAACGSVTHTTASAPATASQPASHAASPSATAEPAINYGQQYLADVAPYNRAAAGSKANPDATWTSPSTIATATASTTFGRLLLSQSWPANAAADVHALAIGCLAIAGDIADQDYDGTQTVEEQTTAEAQVVRADLGLAAVPNV